MSIPLPLLGRGYTSIVLTPQSIGTAGALADVSTAAVTLTARIDSFNEELIAQTENISPMTSTRAHNVVVEDDFEMTFSEIKMNDGSKASRLKVLVTNYDVFKAQWTEGSGASAQSITAYGTRGRFSSGGQGKGKQTASLSFQQVDAGTATYAVS